MTSSPSSPPPDLRGTVRVYLLDHRTRVGKAIDVALLALTLLFVATFVATTYSLGPRVERLLLRGETAIALVFPSEFALRLSGAESWLAEAVDPYTLVDLLAILPTRSVFVLPGGTGVKTGFLRALRVVRVLRFYRFTRDAEFLLGIVSDNTLRAMELLLTVLVAFFLSPGLFYTAEHPVNPDVDTFGDAFYDTVVALSTVGFGDVLLTTAAGRWIPIAAILTAITIVPWQGSRIVREWARRDRVDVTCPECGLRGHDRDASHCKACGAVIYREYESAEQ